MCIYGGHMCICIQNIKFVCLTLCQGEVCTDDTNADDDANANNDRQSMIVSGSLADKPNEPKIIWHVFRDAVFIFWNVLHLHFELIPSKASFSWASSLTGDH